MKRNLDQEIENEENTVKKLRRLVELSMERNRLERKIEGIPPAKPIAPIRTLMPHMSYMPGMPSIHSPFMQPNPNILDKPVTDHPPSRHLFHIYKIIQDGKKHICIEPLIYETYEQEKVVFDTFKKWRPSWKRRFINVDKDFRLMHNGIKEDNRLCMMTINNETIGRMSDGRLFWVKYDNIFDKEKDRSFRRIASYHHMVKISDTIYNIDHEIKIKNINKIRYPYKLLKFVPRKYCLPDGAAKPDTNDYDCHYGIWDFKYVNL